jgi:hypothetical protein
VRSWLPRALLVLPAVLIALEVVVIAPRVEVVALLLAAIWMALPGVALARYTLGSREPSGIAACLLGPAIGFGVSVFGLLLVWAAGLQNWLAILFAPGVTWLAAGIARRFGGPALRIPAFDRRDIAAVSLALLIVPLVTWAPYDHVREPVIDGEAYRAYFTADFIWAMTVTSQIAKGDVPPANPFLKDAPLRYYWMSHLLSGALYRNLRGAGVAAEQVILVNGLAFGVAFIAFFYALARIAGASPTFAAVLVAAAFLANSYEGLNRLWLLYQQQAPLDIVKTLNIDAVTRWFYNGMPVDGLQRMLLYQPHHLTGYVMVLSALWLAGSAEDITETSVALWAGLLLGLGFLESTFTAIIVGVAVALLFAIRLLRQRAYAAVWQSAILGGAPVLVAVGISTALGYTDPSQGLLFTVGPNPVAFRSWPLMLLLSFGPLLIAGIAGLLRFGWVRRDGAAAAALVAAALAFYFFTDVPGMEGVWVGWRSGHLLLIAFAVIGAAAMTAAWRVRAVRVPLVIVIGLALIPALPTVAIDVFNAQDITNRGPGAGFPWTLVITPPEREALDWIRRSTADDAVVQVEPHVRGPGTWAYIPAFGERRAAAGLPLAMIPLKPYLAATDNVRHGIFQARSPRDAHAMARFMGIDYLFVGDIERRTYQPALGLIDSRPDLFPQVFRNDAAVIYAVAK